MAVRASSVLTCLLATACWYPARAHAGQADDLAGEEAPLHGDEMVAVSPRTLKFATPRGLPSCVKAAHLREDYENGLSVGLFKMSAGGRVPWHWHTSSWQVMMVSGSGVFEMKDAELPTEVQHVSSGGSQGLIRGFRKLGPLWCLSVSAAAVLEASTTRDATVNVRYWGVL